jgi:hypothetical protein
MCIMNRFTAAALVRTLPYGRRFGAHPPLSGGRKSKLRLDQLEAREQPGQTTGGTVEPIALMMSTFGAAALLAPLPKSPPSKFGFLSSDHPAPPTTPVRRAAAEPAAERFARNASTDWHSSLSTPSLGIADLWAEIMASVFRDVGPKVEDKEGITLRVLLGRRLGLSANYQIPSYQSSPRDRSWSRIDFNSQT